VIVSPQNILNIYAPDRYSFHKIYNSSGAWNEKFDESQDG
jgi:hypothetical protein